MSTIQNLDVSVDILSALLWQHNQADALTSLLQQKQNWYDTNQSQFWTDWVRDVFDLRTANSFGRHVWAIILGIPLAVTLDPTAVGKPTFGFSNLRKNFGHGNFSSKSSSTASLTADQERLLLQLRYRQLITRGTVTDINKMLNEVFGSQGGAYVLDGLDMTMAYVFGFNPGSQLTFILEQYDVLPRPSTVKVEYRVLLRDAFGFSSLRKNFNHGNFQDR